MLDDQLVNEVSRNRILECEKIAVAMGTLRPQSECWRKDDNFISILNLSF